jgi:channel protein (hemolysin III family)
MNQCWESSFAPISVPLTLGRQDMALDGGIHTKHIYAAMVVDSINFESTASYTDGFNHGACPSHCASMLTSRDMLENMKRLHSWGKSSLADAPLRFQSQLERLQRAFAALEFSSADGHSYEDTLEVAMVMAQLQQSANHLADSMNQMAGKMQESIGKSKRRFSLMSSTLVEKGDTLTQSFFEHTDQFSQYLLLKTENWRKVSEILSLKESFHEKRTLVRDHIMDMWEDGKELISHGNVGFDMMNLMKQQEILPGTPTSETPTSEAGSTGIGARERVWEDVLRTVSELNEYVTSLDAERMQIFAEKFEMGEPKVVSKLPILIFLLSATACLLCSTVYHIFYVQGGLAYEISLSADFAGICLLIAGSFFPLVSYGFYCQPFYQYAYLSIIYALCGTAFAMSLMPWCGTAMRVKAFIAVGAFAVVPLGHLIWNTGLSDSIMNESFLYLIIVCSLYLVGAAAYATQFPERIYPGKFDLFLSSHQIWHLLIVLAALCHYGFALKQYEFAEQASCGESH